MSGTIDIPDDVFESLRFPDREREARLRLELAVSLYAQGALSFGKARRLAGVPKTEFHRELGRSDIERHYSARELEEDLDYAS
jgi:predicted HTH domain antitoxin